MFPSPPFTSAAYALSLLEWGTSLMALEHLDSEICTSNPTLRALATHIKALPEEERRSFTALFQQKALTRVHDFLQGLGQYSKASATYTPPAMPIIYAQGSMSIRDYRTSPAFSGLPLLLVPSLINRPYIFDLLKDHSFIRHLSAYNIDPFMVDWDEPLEEERGFDCSRYITERLEPAIITLSEKYQRPIMLGGYCMGGLFALAACRRLLPRIDRLLLLSTPWDFHATPLYPLCPDSDRIARILAYIESMPFVPAWWFQLLFYAMRPWHVHKKYRYFASLPESSPSYQRFLAIEHWINDGVHVTTPVIKECLQDWIYGNTLLHGRWLVGGTPITPEAVTCPTLLVTPTKDHIVPPAASEPLAQRLPNVTRHSPECGHVGMMGGAYSKEVLWPLIGKWLSST